MSGAVKPIRGAPAGRREDAVRRTISKQLPCPACGVVVADATYTRWPGDLALVAPDGTRIQPESAAVQLRRARAEQDAAPTPAREQRMAYLTRNLDELVSDLRCRNGHSTLRSMPELVRAIRQAGGHWVDLGQ